MTTAITTIPIVSEADAWKVLNNALKGLLPDETIQLDLGDWAELHLIFSGTKFNSSMTTGMMEAFIDLQKNIHRLYAKLLYNDARAILLTDDDRRALDIMVQLSPGSTDAKVILTEAINKLVQGAINKMEAKHYVTLTLAGILCFTSNTMWKNYLSAQNEAKTAGLTVIMSQEETKRLSIFSEAMKQDPHLVSMTTDADEFRNKVLKSAKSADSIQVAGQHISKEQATKLVRATRSQSEEIRLDGEYRIIKVDSSSHDHFKVVLLSKDGKSFPAELKDETLTKARNRELLQEAEWEKKPINLMINGTAVRGEVTSAKIIDVKERFSPGV